MKTRIHPQHRTEAGSLLIFFVFALVVLSAIAAIATYNTNMQRIADRRADMIDATQLAEGGAALACTEVGKALTNSAYTTLGAALLANSAGQYVIDNTLSSGTVKVYKRSITTPFVNRTVTAQIWVTNATYPSAAKVVGSSTVGAVTQTATVQLQMSFGYGAAIISDHPGTTSTGLTKPIGKEGNVVIIGSSSGGKTLIDGGEGYAILANGRANIDTKATVPKNSISMTNYGTSDQLPDYTLEGSPDQLFDFNRFIAVADLTPSGPSGKGNNHFTNLTEFIAKMKLTTPASPMEGVIVVDVKRVEITTTIKEIKTTDIPNGINVRGTLIFNFAPDVLGTDYLMNSCTVNINPANLSGLVATNPATYTTGYPPVYANPAKNPININITSKKDSSGVAFQNFAAEDDLPALMYNVGIFDIHGNANVCGVVYTPSFIEIESLKANQTQYFRGSLISGNGALVDNSWASGCTSIVSYDRSSLDRLATSQNKGKRVTPVFWQ